jgi:hypothetical protein
MGEHVVLAHVAGVPLEEALLPLLSVGSLIVVLRGYRSELVRRGRRRTGGTRPR